MRIGRKCARFLLVASAGAISVPAPASETITYTYDPLGRLVAVQHSGTVNNGQAQSLCYDRAGNRTAYQSSAAGVLASCSSSPPPGSTNQPPVAVNDSGGINRCSDGGSFDVIYNDSDPDGDTPLQLISVTGAMYGVASVMDSTSVWYDPVGANGVDVLTYTVRDARGATATGTLTIEIVTGDCGIEH